MYMTDKNQSMRSTSSITLRQKNDKSILHGDQKEKNEKNISLYIHCNYKYRYK